MNIILIGFMGSGKTTFGKWLSDKQQMAFVDTDELIENIENRAIKDIFASDGEDYFRNLETDALKMLLGIKASAHKIDRSTVISVGGGLPVRKENQELLKKLGKIVFLDASVDELIKRLSGDVSRPLLAGDNLREKIETLMDARLDIYEDLADVIINTDESSMSDIYKEMLKQLGGS